MQIYINFIPNCSCTSLDSNRNFDRMVGYKNSKNRLSFEGRTNRPNLGSPKTFIYSNFLGFKLPDYNSNNSSYSRNFGDREGCMTVDTLRFALNSPTHKRGDQFKKKIVVYANST